MSESNENPRSTSPSVKELKAKFSKTESEASIKRPPLTRHHSSATENVSVAKTREAYEASAAKTVASISKGLEEITPYLSSGNSVADKEVLFKQIIAKVALEKAAEKTLISANELRNSSSNTQAKTSGATLGEVLTIDDKKSLLKHMNPIKTAREIIGNIFALGLIGADRVPQNTLHKDDAGLSLSSPFLQKFKEIGADF